MLVSMWMKFQVHVYFSFSLFDGKNVSSCVSVFCFGPGPDPDPHWYFFRHHHCWNNVIVSCCEIFFAWKTMIPIFSPFFYSYAYPYALIYLHPSCLLHAMTHHHRLRAFPYIYLSCLDHQMNNRPNRICHGDVFSCVCASCVFYFCFYPSFFHEYYHCHYSFSRHNRANAMTF